MPASSDGGEEKRFVGYCADLTDRLAHDIGFKYKIVPVKDFKYGSQQLDGHSWNGMIGELLRMVRTNESFSTQITTFVHLIMCCKKV